MSNKEFKTFDRSRIFMEIKGYKFKVFDLLNEFKVDEKDFEFNWSERGLSIDITPNFINSHSEELLEFIKTIISKNYINFINGDFFIQNKKFIYVNISTVSKTGLIGLYDNTFLYKKNINSYFKSVKKDKVFLINITESERFKDILSKVYTKQISFIGKKNKQRYEQTILVRENPKSGRVRITFAPDRVLFITRVIRAESLNKAMNMLSKELSNYGFTLEVEK